MQFADPIGVRTPREFTAAVRQGKTVTLVHAGGTQQHGVAHRYCAADVLRAMLARAHTVVEGGYTETDDQRVLHMLCPHEIGDTFALWTVRIALKLARDPMTNRRLHDLEVVRIVRASGSDVLPADKREAALLLSLPRYLRAVLRCPQLSKRAAPAVVRMTSSARAAVLGAAVVLDAPYIMYHVHELGGPSMLHINAIDAEDVLLMGTDVLDTETDDALETKVPSNVFWAAAAKLHLTLHDVAIVAQSPQCEAALARLVPHHFACVAALCVHNDAKALALLRSGMPGSMRGPSYMGTRRRLSLLEAACRAPHFHASPDIVCLLCARHNWTSEELVYAAQAAASSGTVRGIACLQYVLTRMRPSDDSEGTTMALLCAHALHKSRGAVCRDTIRCITTLAPPPETDGVNVWLALRHQTARKKQGCSSSSSDSSDSDSDSDSEMNVNVHDDVPVAQHLHALASMLQPFFSESCVHAVRLINTRHALLAIVMMATQRSATQRSEVSSVALRQTCTAPLCAMVCGAIDAWTRPVAEAAGATIAELVVHAGLAPNAAIQSDRAWCNSVVAEPMMLAYRCLCPVWYAVLKSAHGKHAGRGAARAVAHNYQRVLCAVQSSDVAARALSRMAATSAPVRRALLVATLARQPLHLPPSARQAWRDMVSTEQDVQDSSCLPYLKMRSRVLGNVRELGLTRPLKRRRL